MTPLLLRLLDALGSLATWPAIAQLLLQLTVMGALGHLALLWARRSSAALRHLIALAALAALPAVALMGGLPSPWSAWRLSAPLIPSSLAASILPVGTDARCLAVACCPEPEPSEGLVVVPVVPPAWPPLTARTPLHSWWPHSPRCRAGCCAWRFGLHAARVPPARGPGRGR
jgi:hypothetical protein